MKRVSLVLILICLSIGIWADAAGNSSISSRPLYASDLLKIKLSKEAILRTDLPTGLNEEAIAFGIPELDKLMAEIGGTAIIRAHRRVKDTVWEATEGFDRWFLLRLDKRISVENALLKIKSSDYVEDACFELFAYPQIAPNDTYYNLNWGHNNTGQGPGGGGAGFDSNAPEAWDQSQGFGSPDVILAIIDTGVNYNHPDLNDNCIQGYDYGSNDNDPLDSNGHGTQCAGVSAGETNNGIGVAGVAGGCKIMPLKVMNNSGEMTFTAITNAITHAADNDVNVISMSLGAENGTQEGSYPTCDSALNYAYNAGCVILAATANSNTSAIAYPANHPAVISVGAASPTGQRKSMSSSDGENWWGSNYGVNIQDDPKAVDIMAATILPATTMNGSYATNFNGTSCATPYAAGVAALILSKDNGLTPAQVRQTIVSTATDMTIDGGAGWDRYTGYGMINASAALMAVAPGMPSCMITSPANNSVFELGNTISVNVNASDTNGTITSVSFYTDESLTPAFVDDSAPYTWDWDTHEQSPWAHTIRAVAIDNEANVRASSINILLLLPANEGFESGTFTQYPWTNVSTIPWVVQGTDKFSGSFAAKAGAISHNQTTELSLALNVTEAGPISFFSKFSTEANYDYFRFLIDGNQQEQWSGYQNWTQHSYTVAAGTHTFTWRYVKDQGVNTGSDTAWLDHIIFPPHNAPPSAPSNLVALVLSPSSVCLSWNDNSTSETEFYLESSINGGFWSLVDWALADVTTIVNSGLTPQTSYSYRIRAHNTLGDSNYSNTAYATTLGNDSPDNVTATADGNQIELTWNPPQNGCDSYAIWRYLVMNGNLVGGSWLGNVTEPTHSFTDSEWLAQNPGNYRWKVIATLNNVDSPASISNLMTKEANGTIRGIITNELSLPLEGAVVTCGDISATSNDQGEYNLALLPGTYGLTITHEDYEPSSVHDITVLAAQETVVNVQMLDPVAGEDPVIPALTGILSIHPNPFSANAYIRLNLKDASTPYTLSVYNLRGELVYRRSDSQRGEFSLIWNGQNTKGQKLPSGVYLISLSQGKLIQTRKIVLM